MACVARQPPDAPHKAHKLAGFLTSEEDLFIKTHLGEPNVDVASWRLSVSGHVEQPLSLSFDELLQFPQAKVTAFHKCAGSPLFPLAPTPGDVGNVVWSGVRLSDVLDAVRPHRDAALVWSSGQDFGSYRGADPQHFGKDLPLERARRPEVLLATHLNGEPLTRRHGGPVRLVVPGFYATNSVKWLHSLRVATERSPSIFTTKYYNDRIERPDGTIATAPVWAIAPDSVIISPLPGADCGGSVVVSGWAWSDEEIATVEVSLDGGRSWQAARLDAREAYSWQAFRLDVTSLPSGCHRALSRATDRAGRVQPITGARNASVPVDIMVSE
ncbi:sulfite reductase protein [Purpureocillium lilacinum]|uniref:Oxidoreductase, molybdopterin binding n=1 Tax=Purpureocillium lilacinum TaxID=33203 RepID=A0A179GL99_PURLI|nr:sulfite reductase protein [Purpureocillium lilacinum]KAK4094309.1 hypothetical protein Purlil1_914 [Purpureocillium lilacinum]OAQ78131.1 sulfite reductase protein [Purpureocillium lilacinum]PWI73047.1 oxidoreductase, molybdopterin binding [Purpureocillium lilacinum]GJN75862.1 hypothetical protein PLICBS_009970 [Purpureocillium lilacinum]